MSAPRTVVLLIRHALTGAVGTRLVSRLPGINLNTEGEAQACALRRRLRGERLDAIYSSPLERAIQTSRPIAEDRGLDVEAVEELNEVDFGDWTGRSFDELG